MSFRAGFVALIGQPNAGKSTLLNALVQDKVAIVTPKPQTTRQRVMGILNCEDAQICVVDTPGLIRPTRGLYQFLRRELERSAQDADGLLAVLGADEKDLAAAREILDLVTSHKQPWRAVITKADVAPRGQIQRLRELVASYAHEGPVPAVSATTAPENLRLVLTPVLKELVPASPARLFPEELYTDQSVRQMAAELIREQGFIHLHQEVPFSLAVRVKRFEQRPGDVRMAADLVVSREGHRPIVIGAGGQRLKAIGQAARRAIGDLVGMETHLDLHVVVRRGWHQDERMTEELGYAIPQE